MKILHVNVALAGGGLERYLSQVVHELADRGHENLLLYGERDEGLAEPMKARTFLIEHVTDASCRDSGEKLKRVERIIQEENPDVVFVHQVLNPELLDLLTRNRPSLRFVHDFKLVCPDGRKLLAKSQKVCPFPLSYHCQWRAYLYRCMPRDPFIGLPQLRRSKQMASLHQHRSLMIVASKFMESLLLYNGFEKKRVEHIPLFTYLPGPQDVVPPVNQPVIIGSGRLVAGKGMDYLVRAFAKVRGPARLVILGEGPEFQTLRSLARELGVSERVSFPGWIPYDKVAAFYRECAFVVVPSVAPESFGMVGIEAMSYGKPVVAFDVGGIPDWLKHGETGFLLSPCDEDGLREKMDTLIEDPQLAESMGVKARKTVMEKFSPARHVERLTAAFEKEMEAFRVIPG